MIKLERTSDRRVQHLYAKQFYVGSLHGGVIVVPPYLASALDEIKANLSARLAKYPVEVGIPLEDRCPFGLVPAGAVIPNGPTLKQALHESDGPIERSLPPAKKAAKKSAKKAAKKKTAEQRNQYD